MKTKYLNIVLLENVPFLCVLSKIETAFGVSMKYENKKGRYIGDAILKNYSISLIDRIDQLGDFLSDEHHVLKITVEYENDFHYKIIEDDIILKLSKSVKWDYGVWAGSDEDLGKPKRKIYYNQINE